MPLAASPSAPFPNEFGNGVLHAPRTTQRFLSGLAGVLHFSDPSFSLR
jgi:hypothetical protein